MKTIGKLGYQGAIFIYKEDSTSRKAWADAEAINKQHGAIRAELHNDKAEFLAGLAAWCDSIDPGNAFLCIYAHMGPAGINCVSGQNHTRISWDELAKAITNTKKIELIWLVGCNSAECLKKWDPLAGPVRHLLLATSDSKPWRPQLKCFAAEIDIIPIHFYDEMPEFLSEQEPELGKLTTYFRPTPNGFKKAF
jgi:hypothetical protein